MNCETGEVNRVTISDLQFSLNTDNLNQQMVSEDFAVAADDETGFTYLINMNTGTKSRSYVKLLTKTNVAIKSLHAEGLGFSYLSDPTTIVLTDESAMKYEAFNKNSFPWISGYSFWRGGYIILRHWIDEGECDPADISSCGYFELLKIPRSEPHLVGISSSRYIYMPGRFADFSRNGRFLLIQGHRRSDYFIKDFILFDLETNERLNVSNKLGVDINSILTWYVIGEDEETPKVYILASRGPDEEGNIDVDSYLIDLSKIIHIRSFKTNMSEFMKIRQDILK